MLNRSQEKKKCEKNPTKMGKNNPKCLSPGLGHRCEFFISAMPQKSICKVSVKMFSHSQEIKNIQRNKQTDKLTNRHTNLTE